MNNEIVQPTRPGAIDKTSGTPSGFPDFAFEHDGTENNSNPTLTLKSPWGFAVENGLKVADTNNLTTANITYTLPKITGSPQVVSFYWSNGGIYKLTLAVSDSETVGGLAASTWEGEGDGHMVVESNGSNWEVKSYEDYVTDGVNQKIWKYKDGTERQIITSTFTDTINTANGYLFRSIIHGNVTRVYPFISILSSFTSLLDSSTNSVTWIANSAGGATISNTESYYVLDTISNASSLTYKTIQTAIGKWR